MSPTATLLAIVLLVALAGVLGAADDKQPVQPDKQPVQVEERRGPTDRPFPPTPGGPRPGGPRPGGPWYGGGGTWGNGGYNQWWQDRYGGRREQCPPWFRIYGSTYCYKYWRYFQNMDPWTAWEITHNTEPFSK